MDYWRLPLVLPTEQVNYFPLNETKPTPQRAQDSGDRTTSQDSVYVSQVASCKQDHGTPVSSDETDTKSNLSAPMDYWRLPIATLAGYSPATSSTSIPQCVSSSHRVTKVAEQTVQKFPLNVDAPEFIPLRAFPIEENKPLCSLIGLEDRNPNPIPNTCPNAQSVCSRIGHPHHQQCLPERNLESRNHEVPLSDTETVAEALCCVLGNDVASVKCHAHDTGWVSKIGGGLHIGDVLLGTQALRAGNRQWLAPHRSIPLRVDEGVGITTVHTPRGYVVTECDAEPNGDRLFVGDVIRAINGARLDKLEEDAADAVFGSHIADGAVLQVDPHDGMRAEVRLVGDQATADLHILEHRYGLSALNGGHFLEIYGSRSVLIAAMEETRELLAFYAKIEGVGLVRTPPRRCIEELEWEWALCRQMQDSDTGEELSAPEDGPHSFDGLTKRYVSPLPLIDIAAVDVAPPVDVLVLVGIPGAGKSTFAHGLRGWVVVNQDTLGSRAACFHKFRKARRNERRVVIDRCNFSRSQRATWMRGKVGCVWLDVPEEQCVHRVLTRFGHQTLSNTPSSIEVVRNIASLFEAPSADEGFTFIWKINSQAKMDRALDLLFTSYRHAPSVDYEMASSDLHTLRRQIEYYFSDANLPTDAFFQSVLVEDGLIHTDHLLGCPRVQKLWATREDIVKCLDKSYLRIVHRNLDGIYVGTADKSNSNGNTKTEFWMHRTGKSRPHGIVRKRAERRRTEAKPRQEVKMAKSVKFPFRCPECGEGFTSWSLALEHFRDTAHRRVGGAAVMKRELMQECIRAAESCTDPAESNPSDVCENRISRIDPAESSPSGDSSGEDVGGHSSAEDCHIITN